MADMVDDISSVPSLGPGAYGGDAEPYRGWNPELGARRSLPYRRGVLAAEPRCV